MSSPLSKKVWLLAALILVASSGYLLSQRADSPSAQKPGGGGGSGKKGKGAGGPPPVATAKVAQGDMGIYINALGTVTPVYTVSITSRVAGQLMSVNFREGQFVHKGDVLAVIDPRPYDAVLLQTQGQLQRDQALLANAKTDLQRYEAAYAQHAIPEQTLATQKALVTQYEGATKLDQGTVNAAKVNVDYARLTSPINGRIGLRLVDPGNIVQANGTAALLTITQIQPITVVFSMAEDFVHDVATQLRSGHKMRVDAFDRSNQSLIASGSVITIDNAIDVTTGTVKVKANFSNADLRLFPNEFVNARLLVRTLTDANILPTAAIQRNTDSAYVYLIPEGTNRVKSQVVTVTATDGLQSAVTGVKAGDTVVIDGFDKLQDNTPVTVRHPGQKGPRQ